MKKYFYVLLAVLFIALGTYSWYLHSQNSKLKSRVKEINILKSENAKVNNDMEQLKFQID